MPATLILATLLCASPAAPQAKAERWPAPDERIECGPLTIDVYISRTAHLFHVVDQISEWDNACHGQYRRHMQLSSEDEGILRRHSEMRQTKRWGQGLEQTFYTPLGVDAAIKAGKKAGRLNAEQARVVEAALEHFAPRIEELMESQRETLVQAFKQVDRAALTDFAEKVSRFTGVRKLTVPAFPLASPEPGGGGMDGGRLRWELSSEAINESVLIHELTHAFFMPRNDLLQETVERTPGLHMTLLGEGFAYATAPGIYTGGKELDVLASNVRNDRQNDEAWQDPGYGRQREYGLALRPLLAAAYEDGQKLEEFLPRARDVFLALREVEEARPGPTLYIAGPARDPVKERLAGTRFQWSHLTFNHHVDSYKKSLRESRRGDWLVIAVCGDDDERIPAEVAYLSPMPVDKLEKRLRARKKVVEARYEGDLRIVLVAAATQRELDALIAATPLLDSKQHR